MRRLLVGTLLVLILAGGLPVPGRLGLAATEPDFHRVCDLVRSNLAGISEADLNRAALEGLMRAFPGRIELLSNAPLAEVEVSAGQTPALSAARVFDDAYGYLRVTRVENGLGKELAEAIRKLATTNRLEGLVVDLRYAAGRDLSAAGAAADPFISEERKLLDWDNGSASSTAKTNAFAEPVAVLVNARTAGAAEALAAILRQAQVGLLLGAPTAGQAAVQKEFDLGAGYRLRLAVAQLRLADGQAIPLNGLTPDIQVKVSPEDEPQYYADAYKVIARAGPALAAVSPGQAGSATNRPARLTEADLVRMKREGLDPNVDTPPPRKPAAPDKPVVTDPTLLRALDLLKGLAVVREAGRR